MSTPGELDSPASARDEAVQPAAGLAPPDVLRLTLPAVAASASLVRDQLRRWLRDLGWPPEQTHDVLLAVSEAVSNSIEHGYPSGRAGLVGLAGRLVTEPSGVRRVEVTVRDNGTWRPVPDDDENRRRGIPLMCACMDEVVITTDGHGTRVTLTSRPVTPAP